MEIKITNSSTISIKNIKSKENKNISNPIVSGTFYLENKKVGKFYTETYGNSIGFEFINDTYRKIVESEMQRALSDLGLYNIAKVTKNKSLDKGIISYIYIVCDAYYYFKLLEKKKKQLQKHVDKNFIDKQGSNFEIARKSQENTIKSLFYVVPMNFYNVVRSDASFYNFIVDKNRGQLFVSSDDIDLINSSFNLKENDFLITIDSDGVINKL